MESQAKKDTHRKAESIANAQLRQQIELFPQEKLREYAFRITKDYDKQERQIKKQQSEIERLQKRIAELQKPKDPLAKYTNYPIKRDYLAKLQFILERNKHPMTFDEIVEVFFQLEADLNERWRNPSKSISKIISRAVRFGVVAREKKYGQHGSFTYKSHS